MVNLLIVESPGKIPKIQSSTPHNFIVRASRGQSGQLANDGEDNLGFDLTGERLNCRYYPKNSKAKKLINELKLITKRAERIYRARSLSYARLGFLSGRVQSAVLHLLCPQFSRPKSQLKQKCNEMRSFVR